MNKSKSKKSENLFCKKCALEIKHSDKESIEYHKDVCGKSSVVPRNEVKIEGIDKDYKNEKDERSSSKILYDFALSKIKKIVISDDDSDEVYGIISINNHTEVIELDSLRARQWLDYEYSKVDSNEIHSEDFFKNILNSIISKTQMNGEQRVKIYTRIAQTNDTIWYDMATPDWKAIKITKDKVRVVSLNENSPIFRRPQSMKQQIIPVRGDNLVLDRLVDLLRISPKDKLIFKVHLISLFLEAYPIPMMVFDGSAGSLKTTISSTVKMIVDPNGKSKESNVAAMPEKLDDLTLHLFNRYLSSFDNVGSFDNHFSNNLCMAITGGGITKRKLYRNKAEVILNIRRKITLNGIIPSLEYPDLQTRLVNYSRIIIDETNRLTEKEFNQRLAELLPGVLGQIFKILKKALANYDELEHTIKPKERMADFEVWGEAISRALGNPKNEFLKLFHEKMIQGKITSQDAYPIISSIMILMKNKTTYENTASKLYKDLVYIAEEEGVNVKSKYVRFPKSSSRLTRDLRVVEQLLRTMNLFVETYYYGKNDSRFTKHASIVKIIKKSDQTTLGNIQNVASPPSLPSPLENQARNQSKTGEGKEFVPSPLPSPENNDSRYENDTGEGGESSEGTSVQSSSQKYFICWTCNEKGTEPWPVSKVSPNGLTVESHEKVGHSVQYLTAQEVKLVQDYQVNGGLKPDILKH